MKLIRVRCTNCGADFENVEEGQRVFHCTRMGCGATFVVEQGRKFSEVDAAESEKIEKLRKALKQSLSPFNQTQAMLYAQEISAMIPGDFRARVALCLCEFRQGKPRALRRLLERRVECTEPEFLEMFPLILSVGDYRELMQLEGAVEMYLSDSAKISELKWQIANRKEELRISSDQYADIPRDVFICHSSMQQELAMQVVEALEKDGNVCWISGRNLLPDAPDYWQEIRRAVERCRIFLVLTSEASMLSKDVQAELRYAERNGNLRLELKLDDVPHTTQFKYFFNGITWVDASGGLQAALPELKRRVYRLLNDAPAENPVPKPNTRKKPEPKKAVSPENTQTPEAEPAGGETPDKPDASPKPKEAAESGKKAAQAANEAKDSHAEQTAGASSDADGRERNVEEYEALLQQIQDKLKIRMETVDETGEPSQPEPDATRIAEPDTAKKVEPDATRPAEPDVPQKKTDVPKQTEARVQPETPQETVHADASARKHRRGRRWFRFLGTLAILAYALGATRQILLGYQTIQNALLPLSATVAGLAIAHALLCRPEKPRTFLALLSLMPAWSCGLMGLALRQSGDLALVARYMGMLSPVMLLIGAAAAVRTFGSPEEGQSGRRAARGRAVFALLALGVNATSGLMLVNMVRAQSVSNAAYIACNFALTAALYVLLCRRKKPHCLAALLTVTPMAVANLLVRLLVYRPGVFAVKSFFMVLHVMNVCEPFAPLFGLLMAIFFSWRERRASV